MSHNASPVDEVDPRDGRRGHRTIGGGKDRHPRRRSRRRSAVNPLLLTPEEVAEALHVGRTKVYDLLRTRELSSVKVGGSRRIPATAVLDYIERLSRELG